MTWPERLAGGIGIALALAQSGDADAWTRYDPRRPLPPAVAPGGAVLALAPPSDATVLFDGRNLGAWVVPPGSGWKIQGRVLVPGGVVPNKLMTRARFGDVQIHLEFREPAPPAGEGQHRGNSGVFLMGRYEVQIMDPVDNPTYADGTLAAIYGQTPPRVIAARRPGEWQSLDIVFDAPRADAPAYVTVLLNGVIVHDHQRIYGATGALADLPDDHAVDGPLGLQDHGAATDLVAFRNIWVRPLGTSADDR